MALREDINAGLQRLAGTVKFAVPQLDDTGMTRLEVPMPPMLANLRDGLLVIDVHLAGAGDSFTLSTPVAATLGVVAAPFYDALLRRQQRGHQSAGLTFTLEADNQYDALLAVYHWILPSIAPDQFVGLYQKFIQAALGVIADIDGMIDTARNVQRIHPKRG
jgi:hypothetical protein